MLRLFSFYPVRAGLAGLMSARLLSSLVDLGGRAATCSTALN